MDEYLALSQKIIEQGETSTEQAERTIYWLVSGVAKILQTVQDFVDKIAEEEECEKKFIETLRSFSRATALAILPLGSKLDKLDAQKEGKQSAQVVDELYTKLGEHPLTAIRGCSLLLGIAGAIAANNPELQDLHKLICVAFTLVNIAKEVFNSCIEELETNNVD